MILLPLLVMMVLGVAAFIVGTTIIYLMWFALPDDYDAPGRIVYKE